MLTILEVAVLVLGLVGLALLGVRLRVSSSSDAAVTGVAVIPNP